MKKKRPKQDNSYLMMIKMFLLRDGRKKATFLKKSGLFHSFGENCSWQVLDYLLNPTLFLLVIMLLLLLELDLLHMICCIRLYVWLGILVVAIIFIMGKYRNLPTM